MLYSFSLCQFLLEDFSHKGFNETTYAMQLVNMMYSFLQEPFFPTGFLNEVFNEACAYRGNRSKGSVVKRTLSWKERRRRNPDPSLFVRVLLSNS
jgi:hypothetical protein